MRGLVRALASAAVGGMIALTLTSGACLKPPLVGVLAVDAATLVMLLVISIIVEATRP